MKKISPNLLLLAVLTVAITSLVVNLVMLSRLSSVEHAVQSSATSDEVDNLLRDYFRGTN